MLLLRTTSWEGLRAVASITHAHLINDLHVIENETAAHRFTLRIFKKLLVEILLALRLIREDSLYIVPEGEVLGWDHHASPTA